MSMLHEVFTGTISPGTYPVMHPLLFVPGKKNKSIELTTIYISLRNRTTLNRCPNPLPATKIRSASSGLLIGVLFRRHVVLRSMSGHCRHCTIEWRSSKRSRFKMQTTLHCAPAHMRPGRKAKGEMHDLTQSRSAKSPVRRQDIKPTRQFNWRLLPPRDVRCRPQRPQPFHRSHRKSNRCPHNLQVPQQLRRLSSLDFRHRPRRALPYRRSAPE